MQKIRVPVNSFQFGEVSDSLLMRADSPVYASSAQKLLNMIVMAEGSVKKRDGLKHIHDYVGIDRSSGRGQSHLFPFIFSDDEQYLVSIEHQKARVFMLNADGATEVQQIVTDTDGDALPFDRDYLQEYTVTSYGDVMLIAHPLFMTRILLRTGLTSFEILTFTFDQRADAIKTYQPYDRFHASTVTLDPSATTGNISLTTSEPHWVPDHVGTIVRYGEAEIEITSYTSSTIVQGTVVDELKLRLAILNPFRTREGSGIVEVTQIDHGFSGGESVTIEDASAIGNVTSASLNTTHTVLEIIDENTWTLDTGINADDSQDGGGYASVITHAPTVMWDEQAFSAVRGYPAAVVFHQNRLCFAGTISQPDAIWMSKSGSFFNFNVGEAADADAINLVAATGTVNEIRYMVSNRDLQVFGAAGEFYVPTFLNQAITPTNAQVRLQTPYGCEFVSPASIDGATLFAQNGGTVIREYLYTDAEDAYTSTAISTIASHLVHDPVCMTVSHGAFDGAESYAFITTADGDIALFNSNRAEKRASWSNLLTYGDFCSIAALRDRVFVNVWNDDGTLSLLEFTGQIGLDRYVIADVVSNEADVSSAYVSGDVVRVLSADGTVDYGDFTVGASGIVDLSDFPDLESVSVGIPFDVRITSNPIDGSLRNGPMTGIIRSFNAAVIDFRNTYSAKVNGRSIQLSLPFSGKKEYRILGYSRDAQVTIEQDSPLPMQVNGFIAEVSI